MSQRHDPVDELQRANPIDPDRLPSDSTARIWARVEEATMTEETRNAPPVRPRRLAWGAGLAGIAVAGAVAFAVLVNDAREPRGSGGTAASEDAGAGAASCVEMYSLDTLANRSWAFDGTVSAIDPDGADFGSRVTFAVNESFRGDFSGEVTLTYFGSVGGSVTSAGGPPLAVGERYLVAGEDDFVWECGFTQPYDAEVAAQWADALD